MAHYLELDEKLMRQDPLILLVWGDDHHDPRHWQAMWESQCSDCRRVDFETWENPVRNSWVNRLNLAIHRASRPVVLVAHGLGCIAVSWWAELERPAYANPVAGALLVAPPDVDRPGADPRYSRFGSCPRQPLPFPSFLAASQDDPHCSLRTAQLLASDWGSRFAFAGPVGHVDGDSGVSDWQFGKKLLAQLLREHRQERERSARAQSQPYRPHIAGGLVQQASPAEGLSSQL